MRALLYAVTVAGCLAANTVFAEDKPAPAPLTEAPGPSLSLSLKLAQGALDACHARGLAASAAVVDSEGRLRVLLRADGAVVRAMHQQQRGVAGARVHRGRGGIRRGGTRVRRAAEERRER